MKIFTPFEINKISFKNRIVMAPMVPNCAGEDGTVTQEFTDFFNARSRGGAGYIVIGATFVHEDGRGFCRQLGIDKDEHVPRLSRMASIIKQNVRLGIQLSFKSVGKLPEKFSHSEIRGYRQAFVAASARARKAGFDAIELHACHDYWLNYFLSPYFNHRTDDYGGHLDNRFRLLREIVEDILSTVGGQILVGVRLSMTDFIEGGFGLNETLEIGKRLEELGIDYLSASAGIGLTQFRISPPSNVPRGSLLVYARALQQTVSIPVIGVGRLDRPDVFMEAVEGGHVAMAAAARAFIADPEFAEKIGSGREREIRPCICCNYCLTRLHKGEAIRCAVNPFIGRDLLQLEPLSKSSRVLVVGGGPAGMTAATTAALRGAEVLLIDRRTDLGGTLNIASRPPFKETISDLVHYLEYQTRLAGVTIDLNREFSKSLAAKYEPTNMIVATGAVPWMPACLCINNVRVITAENILKCDRIDPGRYLVVGGGLVGLETAEYLAERGAEVTVVEMLEEVGVGFSPNHLKLIVDRLIKKGVNLITETRVTAVEKDGSVQVETKDKKHTLTPYLAVVVASGYHSNSISLPKLDKKAGVDVIGDALQPRSIAEAVLEGVNSAINIRSDKEVTT